MATIAAGVMGLALLPAISAAAPLTPAETFTPKEFFRFCAEAQIEIANVDQTKLAENGGAFLINGTVFKSENDFVFSKSAVNTTGGRILTTQYIQYRDAGATQPELIRCKLRTGESFAAGDWPANSPNNGGRFAVEPAFGFGAAGIGLSTNPSTDQPCSTINQRTINNVWANLSPTEQQDAPFNPTGTATTSASPNTLVTVPDDVVFDGPSWTPPVPAYTLNGSVMELPSRALIAPTLTSGNPRFEGAHYCTLMAPAFLRDLLTGVVAP